MIGTVLKNTCRVVETLGEGGMGSLYVAEHKTLPRRFAVEVLKFVERASPELLAPDWIGPVLDRWGRPNLPFYADVAGVHLARAGALFRLGRRKEARRMVDQTVAAARPERRKGLRAMYRRFVRMCRKMDRHPKSQGRKPFKPM